MIHDLTTQKGRNAYLKAMAEQSRQLSNKKQTAVGWLVEQMPTDLKMQLGHEIIEEAKQMEKEQIIRAFIVAEGTQLEGTKYGVHYYIKTYGSSNEQ